MPIPYQPHANPSMRARPKITREQRKKEKGGGRLLFAALALGQQPTTNNFVRQFDYCTGIEGARLLHENDCEDHGGGVLLRHMPT